MYGSFNTTRLQGAANIPIIPGQLAFRGVMGYEYSDGYYKNGACYGPVVAFAPTKFAGVEGCGDGENIGGKDVWNARAKRLRAEERRVGKEGARTCRSRGSP